MFEIELAQLQLFVATLAILTGETLLEVEPVYSIVAAEPEPLYQISLSVEVCE